MDQPHEHPDTLETFGAGLFDLCARERTAGNPHGEFEILSMDWGPRNAQYKVHVRWPAEKQQELIP